MTYFITLLKTLRSDEEGATAIEYGLIAALIAVAIIGGANFLGGALDDLFRSIGDTVADPAPD